MSKRPSFLRGAAGLAALACLAFAGARRTIGAEPPQRNSAVLVHSKAVFIVDFAAGTASAVPIDISHGVTTLVSPDQTHLAVIDAGGITLFSLEGGQARNLGNITRAVDTQAAWSADGSALAFIQRAGGKTEVRLWSRATGQVKVLL